MNKIVIIEGAQGVGKSSVVEALKEKTRYRNVFSLSGIEDKSDEGKRKIFYFYKMLHDFFHANTDIGFNFILDRTFTTETMYRKTGMVDGSNFDKEFKVLHDELINLAKWYDISTILLVASEEIFRERILSKSDKPQHAKVEFSVENSIKQQDGYIDIWEKELSLKINPVIYITDNKPVETIVEDLLENYIKL